MTRTGSDSSPPGLTRITNDLYLLPTDPSNVYLWLQAEGVTLVDTGLAGSDQLILEALRALGRDRGDVTRIVLTHSHPDHSGGAAAVAAWSGAEVCAGRGDAEVVRGRTAEPAPDLTSAEKPLYDRMSDGQPSAPHCPVHRELDDGESVDDAGGAVVVSAPGHTPGSIALHLPGQRLLLTGDTATRSGDGITLGPFNVDRQRSWRSLRRFAALDLDIACFGHGPPLLAGASQALWSATDPLA